MTKTTAKKQKEQGADYAGAQKLLDNAEKKGEGFMLGFDHGKSATVWVQNLSGSKVHETIMHILEDHPQVKARVVISIMTGK